MKKILSAIVLLLLVGMAAQAQIVSSRGREITVKKKKAKTERRCTPYIRAGLSLNSASRGGFADYYQPITDISFDDAIGFDGLFGIQFPISYGFYWGGEIGLGTRGWSQTDNYYYPAEHGASDYYSTHECDVALASLTVNPMVGWKPRLGNSDFYFDVHIGAGVSVDMFDLDNEPWNGHYNTFDFYVKAGAGFWYKKVNLDVSYRKGFNDMHNHTIDGRYDLTTGALVLALGVAF